MGGILVGVLGVFVGAYLYLNWVGPAREEYRQLQQERRDKQAQLQGGTGASHERQQLQAQLQQARANRQFVASLLASEGALDTLIADLQQIVTETNTALGTTAEGERFELRKFQPTGEGAQIVQDSSLGSALNGNIKRRSYAVEATGTFRQTLAVLREIERLQALLLVRNFQAEIAEPPSLEYQPAQQALVPQTQPRLQVSFRLDALLPLRVPNKTGRDEEGELRSMPWPNRSYPTNSGPKS
ncbi:MAG: hypothetical protein BRC58_09040, partial [Cyanobacteria bacterium QS_8_64_29]